MTISLHAPQIVCLCLLAINVITAPITHGKTKTQNGVMDCVNAAIVLLLLYWGGFWSQP